ncbi:hypothetical protein, partial [Plasmodium yoelii yoelii]
FINLLYIYIVYFLSINKNVRRIAIFYRQCYIVESRSAIVPNESSYNAIIADNLA